MSRSIVHLDADAFFASVEQAADSRLRGKPIAVGGESRGIIASASYEARKFGVYTPMPTAMARKLCPKLIVLPGHYDLYEEFSNGMFAYAYDFTPDVERTAIDEGYFDLTANHKKPAIEIALIISKAIRQSLKITVSEGVASNKLISQIASKLNKPAAFESVPEGQERQFIQPLPNRWLPGIGPKTSARLNAAGLAQIRHVAATPIEMLELVLGRQAVIIVSVIRPGAANEGKKGAFTRRYQGMEPISYPHPSLEACLRSTYGLVVYEEHILQICEAFAGLAGGRADVLRRALNKQKRPGIEEIRGEFFVAALERGHSREKTEEVWGLVTGFAGYAFCKAHSTAYGVEAYQSAWLKRYYPAEFMAAVLTNGKGFYHPLVYVLESHRIGLKFLPPCVNEPGPAFVPHGNAIRVPVTRVKGLTNRTTDALIQTRERGAFTSLADFFHRVAPVAEELEAMIRAGAFDEFGDTRTRQFWQAQHLVKTYSANTEPDQGWLIAPPGLEQLVSVPLTEPTRLEKLQAETELFGYAVSGHPLELFPDVAWDSYCPVNRLGEFVGETVTTCGLVVEQRTHHQITGEPMKFLSLADWTGIVETELFAQTYKNYALATIRYPVLEVEARVEPFENKKGFSLRVLRAGKPRTTTTL